MAMRQKLHQNIDRVYQISYDLFQTRYTFEYSLQRHFFHVQPLDPSEIAHWHKV